MWPFGKKTVRQRRLEVRKTLPAGPSWLARWFGRPGAISAMVILVIFAAFVAALAVWPPDPLPYREGQYIAEPIRARVSFRILDEQRLTDAQEKAASSVPATFQLNTTAPNATVLDELTSRIEKIPSMLDTAGSLEKVEPALLTQLDLLPPTETLKQAKDKQAKADALDAQAKKVAESDDENAQANARKLREDAKALRKEADELLAEAKPVQDANQGAYESWVALAKPEARATLTEDLRGLRAAMERIYVVRPEQVAEQIERAASHVKLSDGQTVTQQRVVDLIGQDETAALREQARDAVGRRFGQSIRPSVVSFLVSRLRDEPIYVYNEEQTAEDIRAAVEALAADPPETAYEHYDEGDVLVQPTRVSQAEVGSPGLSAAKLELLQREHREYVAARNAAHAWRPWLRRIARALVALLLVVGLAAYVARYQPHVLAVPHRGLLLALTLLVTLGLDKCVVLFPQINPHFALLPICMAGVVLAIAYDQRFALAVGAIVALLAIFQTHHGAEMLLLLVVGLVIFIYQLHEIRTRSKLLIASTITAVVIAGVVWLLAVKNSVPWPFALRDSLWAAGSVLLCGFVVQGLLPVIERIYECTTASTLLEWCDASKPLLRRLAMDSPGTYNHSLQLGSMCEAAAERIGARGLLARVGAYYHDIGKINKPRYFTENQDRGSENKHERLSPAMSVLVIVGHVKDGLEMAREYNLPSPLHEFIATHHGTQLVRYFYHTAAKQHEEDNAPAPEESQFRYPGPKPRSREAAILMLADAAESSVRAMTEPTPTRIRTQVHQRVTERLEDGQLDDCLLTLREVHEIEESLIKSLCGMYHGRIAYPKGDKEAREDRDAEQRQGENTEGEKPPAEKVEEHRQADSEPRSLPTGAHDELPAPDQAETPETDSPTTEADSIATEREDESTDDASAEDAPSERV